MTVTYERVSNYSNLVEQKRLASVEIPTTNQGTANPFLYMPDLYKRDAQPAEPDKLAEIKEQAKGAKLDKYLLRQIMNTTTLYQS